MSAWSGDAPVPTPKNKLMPRILRGQPRRDLSTARSISEMGELGLLGATIQGYGCAGVNYDQLRPDRTRDRAGRFRLSVDVQRAVVSLVMYPIDDFGSEAQRETFLPRLARGEIVGCFGLTEPDHGSDPGCDDHARPASAGGFRLSGAKTWITNAPVADLFRRLGQGRRWRDPGLSARARRRGAGDAQDRGQVRAPRLADRADPDGRRAVPEDRCCPGRTGSRRPFSCLNNARLRHRLGRLGAAEFCWHAARHYVLDRKQFGRPLAANQLIQKKLADMQTEITLGLQAALPARPAPRSGQGGAGA